MKKMFQLMIVSLAIVAFINQAFAQRQDTAPAKNALVRLLQSKGIITEQEAAMINDASTPAQAERRLIELLLAKGVITRQEYEQTTLALGAGSMSSDVTSARVVTAAVHVTETSTETAARATVEPAAKEAGSAQSQAQGEVTTVSKFPLKIYGSILFNANYVSHGANTIDIPLFPQKATASADQNHQNFNTTLRQTRFGLRYEGKIFEDAKLTGVFEFDLLGGKPAFANGVNFDIFRVRLAYGRIDWAKDSLEAGQDWAVFSPLNPTSLASYAIPGFSTSGNLWNRMPQIRYEHREGKKTKFIFNTALLDPNAGDSSGNPAARVIGLGERGSLPAFETRIGFTTPSHGKESSAGLSGHYSRLLGVPGNPAGTTLRSPIDSYGVSGDVNLWLSSGFRVTGELFHGRGLGIFSGDIAQSAVVIAGRARGINSTGGWAELHGEAPGGYKGSLKNLSSNVGYGIEDNRDQDLIVGIRKRNQTFMINGQYKFAPSFTVALEYRRVMTDWFHEPSSDQKLNWVSLGFLYSF
jgi:predicted porin